jgi:hypothetical protein
VRKLIEARRKTKRPRSLDAVKLLRPPNRRVALGGVSFGVGFFGARERIIGVRVGDALGLRDRARCGLTMQLRADPLRPGRTALRARRDVRDLPFELGYLLRA